VGPWGFGVGGCTPPSAYLVVCAKLRLFSAFQFSPKLPLPAWLKQRREAAVAAGADAGDVYRWAVLCYALKYVDDIGAASINDLLFDHRGDRVMLARGGVDGAVCQ